MTINATELTDPVSPLAIHLPPEPGELISHEHRGPAERQDVTSRDGQRLHKLLIAGNAVVDECLKLLPRVPRNAAITLIHRYQRARAGGDVVDVKAFAEELERFETGPLRVAVQLLLDRGTRVSTSALGRALQLGTGDLRHLIENLRGLPFIGTTCVRGLADHSELWVRASQSADARSFTGQS